MENPRIALKDFVAQSGANLKDLAKAMGMSRQYLYLLLHTDQLPSREKAAAIEAVTGIPRLNWESLFVYRYTPETA